LSEEVLMRSMVAIPGKIPWPAYGNDDRHIIWRTSSADRQRIWAVGWRLQGGMPGVGEKIWRRAY